MSAEPKQKQVSVGEMLKKLKTDFASTCGQSQAAITEAFMLTFETLANVIGQQQQMIYQLQNKITEYEAMLPADVIKQISETQKSGGNAKVVVHPTTSPSNPQPGTQG